MPSVNSDSKNTNADRPKSDNREGNRPGRYRLRSTAVVKEGSIVCYRPLGVATLNKRGRRIAAAVSGEDFHSPKEIADMVNEDPSHVAPFLSALRNRGFLEWQPAIRRDFSPPVSVVITVRNEPEQLYQCIESLSKLSYPEFEVVVVDDASTDDTVSRAREHQLAANGQLRVVEVATESGGPLGIGTCRNRGVNEANNDIIAFTDSDCRPRSNWLNELVPALAVHDVVGGRTLPHRSGGVHEYERRHSSLDMGPHACRVRPDGATPYLPTANLVATRDVLEEIGFPDRNVAEDVDFCWRALEAGYDVVYTAAGVIEHDYDDAYSTFVSRRRDYGTSEALLSNDHGSTGSVPISIIALLGVGFLFAALAGVDGASWGTAGLFGGLAVSGIVRTFWTDRRTGDQISTRHLVDSKGREIFSGIYAVAREIGRYYSLPFAVGSLLIFGSGYTILAVAGGAVALGALLLPAAVSYYINPPQIGRFQYLGWYLSDHLAYQWGTYRGIYKARTIRHLNPLGRFSLGGPIGATIQSIAKRK